MSNIDLHDIRTYYVRTHIYIRYGYPCPSCGPAPKPTCSSTHARRHAGTPAPRHAPASLARIACMQLAGPPKVQGEKAHTAHGQVCRAPGRMDSEKLLEELRNALVALLQAVVKAVLSMRTRLTISSHGRANRKHGILFVCLPRDVVIALPFPHTSSAWSAYLATFPTTNNSPQVPL